MADLGAVQSADAIVGLITATVRLYKYCQELRKADEIAERVRERLDGLETILNAVRLICRRSSVSSRNDSDENAEYIDSINQACERCEGTIRRIERKLGVFFNASGSADTRPRLLDRRNLVSARPDIHADLENLTAHKVTLGLWLGVLRIHDQSTTQATNAIHALQAKLPEYIHVEVNLTSFLQQQRAISSARQSTIGCDDDATKGNIAVPLPAFIDRPADDVPLVELEEDESQYAEEALSDLRSVRQTAQQLLNVSPTHLERPDVPDVLTGQDEEALTYYIEKYYSRGQKNLHASKFSEAESDFNMAIAYSKQRYESYGIPFLNREVLLENLARAHHGLKQWILAINIVEKEILSLQQSPEPDTNGEGGEAPPSDGRAIARQNELLGALYLGLYHECNFDADRNRAHVCTQTAYKTWRRLMSETEPLSEDDLKCYRGCLQQLINMLRSKGDDIEADYYEELLMQSVADTQSISIPKRSSTITSFPGSEDSSDLSILRRFSTGHITSIGAFREAIKGPDDSQLQRLHDLPAFEWHNCVNERNSRGETALHYAADRGNPSIVSFLLGHSAKIDAIDDQGQTPLFRAVHKKRRTIVDLLLQWESGKLVHDGGTRTVHDGGTLLHEAVKSSTTDCAQQLLNADPGLLDLADRAGQTALHLCADRAHVDQVKLLISMHADLSAPDIAQQTPLHLALSVNDTPHEQVFLLLHDAGASTGMKAPTRQESERQKRWLGRRETVLRRQTTIPAAAKQSSTTSVARAQTEVQTGPTPLRGGGKRRSFRERVFG